MIVRRSLAAVVSSLAAATLVVTGAPSAQGAVSVPKPVLIVDGAPRACGGVFCYVPGTVTVKAGTTVRWTNASPAPHTVTGLSGGPSSGTVNPGLSYSYRFTTAGTYTYYCLIHGFAVMHATVVVTG